MKKIYLTLPLFLPLFCFGQLAYTENTYDFTVETDLEYGTSTDYSGQSETLLLDIYKPVGDNNCKRPCLVLVHGGSWIAGSKEDATIVNIAKSFAEKGWVVAAINYRLGTHKAASYAMYAFCNDEISAPCGYIADSAEVYRANYRGQQDAKGAIRYMKSRKLEDSIDVQNVFIAGESAGAFIAYAATFMTEEIEKYPFCDAISDAPNPDADLVSCLPIGYSLSRPDLGAVNGELHLGEFDASVQGVGGFYGGMLNFEMLSDETDWPVVYMFHQGSDVVVHYNYNRLLGRIDWECYTPTNLCQNYARYPRAFGSKGIETYLAGLGAGPERVVDIIENYEYTGDCFDNGHSIDNWVLRSNAMAELFANRIEANGNTPYAGPCDLSIEKVERSFQLYPNPSGGEIHLVSEGIFNGQITIYTLEGKIIDQFQLTALKTISLSKGIYLIQLQSSDKNYFEKVIVY